MLHPVIDVAVGLACGFEGVFAGLICVQNALCVRHLQTNHVGEAMMDEGLAVELVVLLYQKNDRDSRCFILSVFDLAIYYFYSYIISCPLKNVNRISKLYLFAIALLPLSWIFFIF